MKELSVASMNFPVGSLEAYIRRVNLIPLLTKEEEYDCAQRFRNFGDLEAARRLVLAHLRYVVRVARGYLGYGLPLSDLIQEGSLGLMKAVKRFDANVGVRLVSFAVHWIKAEIHEFVLRNWRIVKIATTKAQRKLFFNLRQMKSRLGWLKPEEIDTMASELNVSREDVIGMERRLSAMDMSFDSSVNDDDDEALKAPEHYLYESRNDPAYLIEQEVTGEQGREQLFAALECLDERSQDILRQRWLNGKKSTLQSLATQYDISAERVRQLEKTAMERLRQNMSAA